MLKRSEKDRPSSMSDWPRWLQEDLATNSFNGCVGSVLVSESSRARVWHISLQPGERLPFHRHVLDYLWTTTSAGQARSYYEDGRMIETEYKVGDTAHLNFGDGEHMLHDITNIGETELGFVTVEFLESANEPLPLPEAVRLRREAA
jgi:beta-alanine degradation protein BauB